MAIEFRVLTDEEVAAAAIQWERDAEQQAEHERQVKACAEEHGSHVWEMHLYHPEDDSYVSLRCEHCPAGLEDIFLTDGIELVYAELDDGVKVEGGRHDSTVALIAPVTVEVWSTKGWTDYGWDYDCGVEIEQRGPARHMFPDGGE